MHSTPKDIPPEYDAVLQWLEPLPPSLYNLLADPEVPVEQAVSVASNAFQSLSWAKLGVVNSTNDLYHLHPSDPSARPQLTELPAVLPRLRTRTNNNKVNPGKPSISKNTLAPRPELRPTLPSSYNDNANENDLSTDNGITSYLSTQTSKWSRSTNEELKSLSISLEEYHDNGMKVRAVVKFQMEDIGCGYIMFRGRTGEALKVFRSTCFAESEKNHSKHLLSQYKSFTDLSIHLSNLALSLPELIYRLPSYLSLTTKPCHSCSQLLKKGVLPVGRGWISSTELASHGKEKDGDVDMDKTEESTSVAQGEWVAFHLDCWEGIKG